MLIVSPKVLSILYRNLPGAIILAVDPLDRKVKSKFSSVLTSKISKNLVLPSTHGIMG